MRQLERFWVRLEDEHPAVCEAINWAVLFMSVASFLIAVYVYLEARLLLA